MSEKFITIVIALISFSELLDKHYLVGTALFLIVIGKLLGFKAEQFKRKKTKNNIWLRASIMVSTVGFILGMLHVVTYVATGLSK
jgi:hypothetical protein